MTEEQKKIIAYKVFDKDLKCREFQYEEWLPVPGFVGLYEVSSEGRVRSLPRQTSTGILGGCILKQSVERNGYIRVSLSASGVKHRELLHRLVLRVFVGECPDNNECRHLDGDKKNCCLSNLEWGTRKENARDRILHGTHVDNRGERHGMTRISDSDARDIVVMRNNGIPLAEVAEMFSVSKATVSRISCGTGWKHIDRRIL